MINLEGVYSIPPNAPFSKCSRAKLIARLWSRLEPFRKRFQRSCPLSDAIAKLSPISSISTKRESNSHKRNLFM